MEEQIRFGVLFSAPTEIFYFLHRQKIKKEAFNFRQTNHVHGIDIVAF